MWCFIWRSSREREEEEAEEEEDDEEEDDDEEEKDEDEEEKEEEPFTFREVSAHRLVSETHKIAGVQLYPLLIIPPECRTWVLELPRRKLGLEP